MNGMMETPVRKADIGQRMSWVVTTRGRAWLDQPSLELSSPTRMPDMMLRSTDVAQTVEGFGGCFNELGWVALSRIPAQERASVLAELFAPGVGLGLSVCRMPLGANDFSTDWYSYDEVDGDFALENFSIEHDRATLIPYIQEAKRLQPELRLWASPWSPPTWMKYNQHYAAALPWPGSSVENGIREDQLGREGSDLMNQDPVYLEAYARYFARFVEAYRAEGIDIEMVMPQNEFNSAQVFPSCPWTPEGLARFIAVLGPQMDRLGVKVYFGTQERGNPQHFAHVLADEKAGPWVKGAGFQWNGKHSIADAHRRAPHLPLYQTEQECGDGQNDWRYCRYTWTLLRRFFESGASAYTYWNLALDKGGESRWGWRQNSLVVVDPDTGSFEYTHEYYLMRHVAHFVRPGARRVETFSWSGYENQLAFLNPDGSLVLVIHNDHAEALDLAIGVDGCQVEVTLPADSFSTFVLPAA